MGNIGSSNELEAAVDPDAFCQWAVGKAWANRFASVSRTANLFSN